MHSFFDSVDRVAPDPILNTPILFQEDVHRKKVNLGIGTYRTTEGLPYIFETVRNVENSLTMLDSNHEYLPIEGNSLFLEKMVELNFGKASNKERIFSIQSIGGTGALKIIAEFIKRFLNPLISIPSPTWENHQLVFKNADLMVQSYPYYSTETNSIVFEEMLTFLKSLPIASTVLLQSCCHNPTGADLSKEQWKEILEIFKIHQLFPLFDNAYQGFGSSIEDDVYPIRLFYESGLELGVVSSCSKNFGLYGERVGCLHLVINGEQQRKNVASQMKRIVRSIYSSPPIHGALLVAKILSDESHYLSWKDEIDNLKIRIQAMRENFWSGITSNSGKDKYQFVLKQKGFFSLLGLSEKQVLELRNEKGIYLLLNSRINFAALTPGNLNFVIENLASL